MQITKFIVFSAVVATFVSADHAVPAEAIDTSKIDKLPASAVAGRDQSGEMQSLRTVDTASGKATEERVPELKIPPGFSQRLEKTLREPISSRRITKKASPYTRRSKRLAAMDASSMQKMTRIMEAVESPSTKEELNAWKKTYNGELTKRLSLMALLEEDESVLKQLLNERVPSQLHDWYTNKYHELTEKRNQIKLRTFGLALLQNWPMEKLAESWGLVRIRDTFVMAEILETYHKIFERHWRYLDFYAKRKMSADEVHDYLKKTGKDNDYLVMLSYSMYEKFMNTRPISQEPVLSVPSTS